MTITEFLTARYDEEEAAARAVIEQQEHVYPAPEFVVGYEWSRLTRHTSGGCGVESVAGAPSPARVLREVAAKRAVVDLHVCSCSVDCGYCGACSGDHGSDPTPAPCDTLRHMAAVYADHPDHDRRWQP